MLVYNFVKRFGDCRRQNQTEVNNKRQHTSGLLGIHRPFSGFTRSAVSCCHGDDFAFTKRQCLDFKLLRFQLTEALGWIFDIFCSASLYHLLLISTERYAALKHPIFHNRSVTNTRIVISSVTAWLVTLVTCLVYSISEILVTFSNILRGICVVLIFCFCVVVYKEVHGYKKQAMGQHLSREVKKKMFNEIKIVKTTMTIAVTALICYVPTIAFFMVTAQAGVEGYSPEFSCGFLILATLLSILNSLFNPLIYAVRSRRFRVASIQLLTRQSFHRAQRIDELLFGVRRRRQQSFAEGNGDGIRNNRIGRPKEAALQFIAVQELAA